MSKFPHHRLYYELFTDHPTLAFGFSEDTVDVDARAATPPALPSSPASSTHMAADVALPIAATATAKASASAAGK